MRSMEDFTVFVIVLLQPCQLHEVPEELSSALTFADRLIAD
jgi:hypothetical protein